MSGMMASVLMAVLTLAMLLFLVIRLRFFAGSEVSGRATFVIGGLLVLSAAAWQIVSQTAGFGDWFLESAYPWLDLTQLIFLVVGLLLLAVGLSLYSDYWQTRAEDIDNREERLALLENLQRDAREPYQLMEMLNISIKEILTGLPECAGAIFLLNRSRRQLVLTAYMGLSRNEIASLEYYPFGRNLVSQAVDVGEPLMGGNFAFFDRGGETNESRFQSSLVLPLVSGLEKIGAVVLLTEKTQFFSRSEVRYLAPVAEWLAEKIKSARLIRELTAAEKRFEKVQVRQTEMSARMTAATEAFSAADTLTAYCRSLTGLFDSRSAHIMGIVNGLLDTYGGSEPLSDMTESYRTAMIDALDRDKPLIINQEAVTDDGTPYVAWSSLVFPIGREGRRVALVLRRESGPFNVGEGDLGVVEIFARMARLVMRQNDYSRLDITRRKGLARIIELLRFDADHPAEADESFLVSHMSDMLPAHSGVLAFTRQTNGSLRATRGTGVEQDFLSDFDFLPGEGIIGRVLEAQQPQFVFGRTSVGRSLESLEATNREAFYHAFGERGLPTFMAACPIAVYNRQTAIAVVFMYDIMDSERGEYERLLTLAAGLYSVRLTIAELFRNQAPTVPVEMDGQELGGIINRLNNHLSAIIGNAELAVSRSDISGDIKRHIDSILGEAEQAAGYVKSSLGKAWPTAGGVVQEEIVDINDILAETLEEALISENLYMIGGRPREVFLKTHPVVGVAVPGKKLHEAIVGVIGRMAEAVDDDEVITVSTYHLSSHVYFDISRHRKQLPALERAAGFGEYQSVETALRFRNSERFLSHLTGYGCFFASDRAQQPPLYMSLKFPTVSAPASAVGMDGPPVSILAIDDQPVILELMSAMCQSLGYEVVTASSGEVGLRLSQERDFDVIVTDLAMPGMSGLELAARIKQDQRETPSILVTGWEVTIPEIQLEAAGITGILHKPFRIEQLTEIIGASSKRSHAR